MSSVKRKYEVLKHCLGHAPGDQIELHPRQAVSLVAGGLLTEVKSVKTTRKTTSKDTKTESDK